MKLSERADLGGRSLQLEERTGAARRPWLVAWLGLPVLGIANGAIRDATYKQATGELAAHQLLHGLPVGAHGRLPVGVGGSPADPDPPGGLGHQRAWAVLTILFEFGFGHWVVGDWWSSLLGAYNLAEGRVWAVVPLWTLLGPEGIRRLRVRR